MIPKFRVFAKSGTKEFFGGGYDRDQMFYEISEIDFYNKTVTVWGCHHKDCGMCDDTYKMEDVEIMVSTGIKDKEGVEIFEGDIVKVGTLDGEPIGYIEWKTDMACYHVTNYITPFGGEVVSEYHSKDFEIIGNIYENLELLEVAE